jgi:hypothetical protein
MVMKYINAILLGTLLSFFCFPVLAQDEKNYDAVYNSILKEYTLNPDGSTLYHYVKDQKLLTYRAINGMYGETFVVYNPRFQKLEVAGSATTMADGKLVKAPANAFNEVLPGFAANAPDFNMLREMVITHTALEKNTVIHLDYTIRSEKGFYSALAGNEVLSETEPVRSLTVRIKVPVQQELAYKIYNIKGAPVTTTEGNMRVYTWKFENVPVISAEENQVTGNELYPRLIFTTGTDADQEWAAFSGQQAFSAGLTDGMKKETDRMASDVTDKTALALKIQEKVVSEVSLTAIPMKYSGFRLRTPGQVWDGNYGTLPEKALLLSALLNQAGIPAWPVAVLRASLFDGKIADLNSIEDMIVKVAVPGGEVLWLSAASLNGQDLSRTMPGKVFVVFAEGGRITEIRTGTQEAVASLSGNLFINEKNEVNGEVTASLSGPVNPSYTLQRDKEKARQWISGGVGRQDIKEVKLSQPGPEASKFTFQVQKENAQKKDTMLRTLTLPYLSNGIESWSIKLLPSYRNKPFEVPCPLNESVDLTLTVPEGYELLSPEDEVNITNAAGSCRFEVKREAGKIIVNKELKISQRIIEPKNYAAFKSLMDNWNAPHQKEVVFIVR